MSELSEVQKQVCAFVEKIAVERNQWKQRALDAERDFQTLVQQNIESGKTMAQLVERAEAAEKACAAFHRTLSTIERSCSDPLTVAVAAEHLNKATSGTGYLSPAEVRELVEKTTNDIDEEWLSEIGTQWLKFTGKPWATRDGETRQEGLSSNVGALMQEIKKASVEVAWKERAEVAEKACEKMKELVNPLVEALEILHARSHLVAAWNNDREYWKRKLSETLAYAKEKGWL